MATQDAYPIIQGPAATGGAVSGNPVLMGAQDSSGNVSPLVLSGVGPSALRTYITSATGTALAVQTFGDAAGAVSGVPVGAYQLVFNGANNDRVRNNVDVTLLASAARTTVQNSANITTYNARGIIVTVDVTATVSTVSLTPSINYIDPASGKAIPLLTATAIAATGTFTYWIDMNAIVGTPAPFTKTAQADLGRIITISIAVGNANSQTYSVGYTLIPG